MTIPEDVREAIQDRLNRVAYHLEDGFNPVGLLYPYTAEQADIMRGLLDDLHAALAWLDAQPAAPEPDWSKAPDWAQWWAVDADGRTYWYDRQPYVEKAEDGCCWDGNGDFKWAGDVDLPVDVDWRTTLRRRAEAQP